MPGMTSSPGQELTQIQANLKAMLERMGPQKAQAHPSYTGATPTTMGAPGTPAPGAAGAPGAPTDPMAMYRQALEGLSGGGAMLESSLADIETGKKEAIGAGQQQLVSSGLAGTTMMAGVPLQAEKGAGRARLAARGQVEQLRLQTLASYAGLAQQAKLASAERTAAGQRLQTQLTAQKAGAAAAQKAESDRIRQLATEQRRTQMLAGMRETGGWRPFEEALSRPSIASGLVLNTSPSPAGYGSYVSGGVGPSATAGSINYAQQFPSIYNETEQPVPNWM